MRASRWARRRDRGVSAREDRSGDGGARRAAQELPASLSAAALSDEIDAREVERGVAGVGLPDEALHIISAETFAIGALRREQEEWGVIGPEVARDEREGFVLEERCCGGLIG